MPNHVTNIVTVTGSVEAVAGLKSSWFRHEPSNGNCTPELPDMVVDFNGLLPMPESLNIECGSTSSLAEEWLAMKDDWLLSGKEMAGLWFADRLKEHTSAYLDWQTDTVGRLKEVAASEPGLLEKIGLDKQYLEKIRLNLAMYGCSTWYEWHIRNWGTKWNAYNQHLSEWSDTSIRVTFDTAWSPPEPVYAFIAENFPDIEMEVRYIDEGGGFAGTYHIADGVLSDFPCSDEEFRMFAGNHFGWEFDGDAEE